MLLTDSLMCDGLSVAISFNVRPYRHGNRDLMSPPYFYDAKEKETVSATNSWHLSHIFPASKRIENEREKKKINNYYSWLVDAVDWIVLLFFSGELCDYTPCPASVARTFCPSFRYALSSVARDRKRHPCWIQTSTGHRQCWSPHSPAAFKSTHLTEAPHYEIE